MIARGRLMRWSGRLQMGGKYSAKFYKTGPNARECIEEANHDLAFEGR